jgi:hypothetical protein
MGIINKKNTDLWSFSLQIVFLVKSKANPFAFWDEIWYFSKYLKIYVYITSNQVRIWDSREINMDFRPNFATNWGFWWKQILTNLDFDVKFDIFQNIYKLIYRKWTSRTRNMNLWPVFVPKRCSSIKPKANLTLCNLRQNLIFLKFTYDRSH